MMSFRYGSKAEDWSIQSFASSRDRVSSLLFSEKLGGSMEPLSGQVPTERWIGPLPFLAWSQTGHTMENPSDCGEWTVMKICPYTTDPTSALGGGKQLNIDSTHNTDSTWIVESDSFQRTTISATFLVKKQLGSSLSLEEMMEYVIKSSCFYLLKACASENRWFGVFTYTAADRFWINARGLKPHLWSSDTETTVEFGESGKAPAERIISLLQKADIHHLFS